MEEVTEMRRSDEELGITIDEELDTWVGSLKMKLDESFVPNWRLEPCSIFRVPPSLQTQDPEAYAPRVVSIGPYHRGRESLMEMEMRKHRMARRLFSKHPDIMMAKCVDRIRALEKKARSYYADKFEMVRMAFAEMMVLDGCFIIGVLLSQRGENWVWEEERNEEEEICNMHNLALIDEDLIKVENQIPFFIVENLYQFLVPEGLPISHLAVNHLEDFLQNRYAKMDNNRRVVLFKMDSNVKSRNHLLHLLYQILSLQDNRTKKSSDNHLEPPYLPDNPRESQDPPAIHSPQERRRFNAGILNHPERVILTPLKNIRLPSFLNIGRKSSNRRGGYPVLEWMRNATELQEAGVKFKAKESGTFLDVSFNNGVMEIPTLYIFQNTLPILRNLIAFEQYYPKTGGHFTFFADLMDSLIDTPKDVMVLQAAGILKIGLSNQEEVAEVFNRLCRDVYYHKGMNYLGDVYYRVNYYCDSRWHRYRTVLARDYFNNPWMIISVVAAVILLLLTFLQTLYSMLGYYKS